WPCAAHSNSRRHLTQDSLQLIVSRWSSLSAHEFSKIPTIQQKPAQLLMRCAVYSELCAEQRCQQTPSHRVSELTNGNYGENSNNYRSLARDRSGARRSVVESWLQRSRK